MIGLGMSMGEMPPTPPSGRPDRATSSNAPSTASTPESSTHHDFAAALDHEVACRDDQHPDAPAKPRSAVRDLSKPAGKIAQTDSHTDGVAPNAVGAATAVPDVAAATSAITPAAATTDPTPAAAITDPTPTAAATITATATGATAVAGTTAATGTTAAAATSAVANAASEIAGMTGATGAPAGTAFAPSAATTPSAPATTTTAGASATLSSAAGASTPGPTTAGTSVSAAPAAPAPGAPSIDAAQAQTRTQAEQHPEAAQTLQASSDELRRSLEQSGAALLRLDISTSGRGEGDHAANRDGSPSADAVALEEDDPHTTSTSPERVADQQQVLEQAGTAMLAQAQPQSQMILKLLQG